MTPSGIEPATFRLVTQCLNQLRYCVPPLHGLDSYLISAQVGAEEIQKIMHIITLRAEIRKGETPNRKHKACHCTTIALHYEQLIVCVCGRF